MSTHRFNVTRNCSLRTFLMFLASTFLHALIIVTAWFWPYHPAHPEELPPIDFIPFCLVVGSQIDHPPTSSASVDLLLPPTEPLPIPDSTTTEEPPPADDPHFSLPAIPPFVSANHLSPRHPITAQAAHPTHVAPATGHLPIRDTTLRASRAGSFGSTSPGSPSAGSNWKISKPPYPYAMRAARAQGSGTLRVATNASGQVTEANVTQSSGSSTLDENTSHYARSFWSGPPNSTRLVPFTYQLP